MGHVFIHSTSAEVSASSSEQTKLPAPAEILFSEKLWLGGYWWLVTHL